MHFHNKINLVLEVCRKGKYIWSCNMSQKMCHLGWNIVLEIESTLHLGQSIQLYGWWFVQIQMTTLNPCTVDLYNGMDCAVWICTIVRNPVRLPLQTSDGSAWLVRPPYKCLLKCCFSHGEKLEVQCLSLSNSMLEFHSCDGVSSSLSSAAFDTIEMNQNPNSNCWD